MSTRPARIPVSIQLDANGNGTFQKQPFPAFWSTLTATLRAASLSAPVFDLSLGTDPILFGAGQRCELGPFIINPTDTITIAVTNGQPNDTVVGSLWGVQADTDVEAAAALGGVVANGYVPPPRVYLQSFTFQGDGLSHQATVPIPGNAVGLLVVYDNVAQSIATGISAAGDKTGATFQSYASAGGTVFSVETGAQAPDYILGVMGIDRNAVFTVTTQVGGSHPGTASVFALFVMPPLGAATQTGLISGLIVKSFNFSGTSGSVSAIVSGVTGKTIRIHSYSAFASLFPNPTVPCFFEARLRSDVSFLEFAAGQSMAQTAVGNLGFPIVGDGEGFPLPTGEGIQGLVSLSAAGSMVCVGTVNYTQT